MVDYRETHRTYLSSHGNSRSLQDIQQRSSKLSVVDKYKFLGKIGSGTYGVVFKAVSRKNDNENEYAIKKFKSTTETEGLSQSALREISLYRELKHENIIQLKEVLLDPLDRSIYMVFDYAEYDLLQILQHHRERKRLISEVTVKSILWQLLNGVSYLHANWILHRDLKPANILVIGDGLERGVVKIADLGLARIFQQPLQPLTWSDRVVVTIWYRAPELMLGARHYTKSIDIWAIGCIFGELLTLRPLFKGVEEKTEKGQRTPFQKDQLDKIFTLLGFPDKKRWPTIDDLPGSQQLLSFTNAYKFQLAQYISRISAGESGHSLPHDGSTSTSSNTSLSAVKLDSALSLMTKLLEYDPLQRISADDALSDPYFDQEPHPKRDSLTSNKEAYIKRSIQVDDKDLPLGALDKMKNPV